MIKRISQAQAIEAVIAASIDIERNEYPSSGGSYFALSDLANHVDGAGRAEIARAAYLYGGAALRGSRAFDNCFENGDGDQVVAELVKQAAVDPVLYRAIADDFGGAFPAGWLKRKVA